MSPPPMMSTGIDPNALERILSSASDDALLSDLIDALPIGVVVIDEFGRVVRYNAYEQTLANRTARSVIGRPFFRDVAPCTATSELAPAFERYVRGDEPLKLDIEFQFPFPHLPVPRDVKLRLRGFRSGERKFAFLLIEDVSEEVQARRLRELLAMLVAHDMKNPLAALRLNVDIVMREVDLAGRLGERLGEARLAADRLDRMIRLFLDVYKLEHAELPVARERLDLVAIVGEVVRAQRPLAESDELALTLDGDAPLVNADAGLIARVVENLIDNAMRHARSAIRVSVGTDDGGVFVEVGDDGTGVPDDAKEKIFDKFASMSPDMRGYNQGLGLTFCSLAVRRLGGTIAALDAAPRGALFRVWLPLG